MMAQRDPWVNMLRTTLAAFAAGVGGADTVLVQPFDTAIAGGLPGTAASFARRMARNTQLLLLEESHVGRVLDPAGGSWFVEDLTRRLAEEAWKHFQDIEARGGFVEARDHVVAEIDRVARRAAATTSPTGAPRSPASTSTPTSPRLRCRQRGFGSGVARYAAGVRGAAGPVRRPSRGARARGRGRCCSRSARWPSTTSAPRSPRTCWRPAASRRSTRAPSTRPGRRRCRLGGGAPGGRGDLRHRRALRHRGRRTSWKPLAQQGFRTSTWPARRRRVGRRGAPPRRLPDRQDRRDRGAVDPAHPIGGLR